MRISVITAVFELLAVIGIVWATYIVAGFAYALYVGSAWLLLFALILTPSKKR